ncbi:MAG: TIGR03545 family protein [Planctomycetota bacterium]
MIRWRFLITRLLVVVVVLLLVSIALSPVARYVTVKGLQAATGAKVDIADADVTLFPPSIRYEFVQIADPRDGKELRDAIRADAIELSLDNAALLRRRWVVESGRIVGLQIGADREESGHFEVDPEEEEVASTSQRGSGILSKMLSGLTSNLEDQATDAVANLETARRAEEIKARYRLQYERLIQQAKDLESRVRAFRDSVEGIENPLRDWENLERSMATANEARAEWKSIMAKIDALPEQFKADIAALDDARQADLRRVDQFVPGNLEDSKNFGVDLITASVKSQLEKIQQYCQTGRTLANYTVVAPESDRQRGVDVDLFGGKRLPQMLVKRCEVSGLMRDDGNAYTMTGVVENMTNQPELLEQPLRAQLQLEGPQFLKVDYVRDRRNESDVDLVTLHWPACDVAETSLGKDADAMVYLAGGSREVWVQLRTEGDGVSGRFVSKQTGTRIRLEVDSKYASLPATEALRQSLAAVDLVEIDAGFSGTWDKYQLQLNTNLDEILGDATRRAVESQLAQSRQRLAAQIDRVHSEQTEKLTQWFAGKQVEALTLSAGTDGLVEALNEKLFGGVDSAEVTLGRLREYLR